jgi:hypothetical protein
MVRTTSLSLVDNGFDSFVHVAMNVQSVQLDALFEKYS